MIQVSPWTHLCVRLQELKSDGSVTCGNSSSGTPQVVSSCVRVLAQALGHIEQGIERRFLKHPLGGSASGMEGSGLVFRV